MAPHPSPAGAWYSPTLDPPNVSEKNLARTRQMMAAQGNDGAAALKAGPALPEGRGSTFYPLYVSAIAAGLVVNSMSAFNEGGHVPAEVPGAPAALATVNAATACDEEKQAILEAKAARDAALGEVADVQGRYKVLESELQGLRDQLVKEARVRQEKEEGMRAREAAAKDRDAELDERQGHLGALEQALEAPQEEAGHGDTGSGISGVLYKWVNYGRGWRPRWFALSDGVLSYYKIHGPDRIDLSRDTDRGAKVIGEDSLRRLARPSSASAPHSNGHGHHQTPRKPLSEIHLKVSTVRESRSDDRRFSIFSGTKRLHLRAETREDRAAWLEALCATKEMFPRMSTSEMVGPGDTAAAAAVSTERLKKRLQQEGVSDAAIADSERIVREEFEALHKQLVLLKQKQALLLDTLRHLEIPTFREGSGSESDDYNEPQDPAEEETDDEENIYFDTTDFLSSSSFKSSGSDFQRSEAGSDDEDDYPMDGIDPSMKSVGINYPYVRRRKKLPDPVEKEKGVSLCSKIKDNIGKDLTKVCLPVYFNEPLSSLQKCFEDLEYSYLIDRAYEWGKRGDSVMRILSVAAFVVSGYASTDGRSCKPFNPLLGETYEADYPDKGLRFFSEKVSHHPMVV
ncbi:oxysterol-binding protein-related protein 1C-like, partial [Triticum dicoccoides]|uniref:oxysterol-binding protein-related protein 1C-like n=1 Tax=Triticum dicoccoides TaxID=85692 RepID=UPI00188FF062